MLHRATLVTVITVVIAITLVHPAAQEEYGPVHIVDAESGKILKNRTILTEGRRIAKVARSRGEATATLYAVPALIDGHVHYIDPDTYGPLFVANGVALVRDMAGDTATVLANRAALDSGEMFGPAMIGGGKIIDGSPPIWPFSYECTTPEQAREAVRELHAAGVDFIKVYSLLEPDVYAAACDEANRVGLRCVGHIPDAVTVEQATEAGQFTAEHLMKLVGAFVPISPEDEGKRSWQVDHWQRYPEADPAERDAFLARLAESGMVQCPTLVVHEGMVRTSDGTGVTDDRMRYVQPWALDFWNGNPGYAAMGERIAKTFDHRLDFVRRLHEAGVPLIAGTDLANPFVFAGASVHRELELFVEAGIPHAEALRSATALPAELFGVDDRFGAIEAGREASFFLTTVNPLEDLPGALAAIEAVVFRGELYDAEAIAELEARAEKAVVRTAATAGATEEDTAEVEGEVIHEGRFKLTFGQWDAGHEDFRITKTADGYRVYSINRPQGGPQSPTDTVYFLDEDKRLVRVEHTDKGAQGYQAVYELDGDTVVAQITVDGKAGPELELTLGDDRTLVGPTWVLDYFSSDASGVDKLAVGQSVEFKSTSFGWDRWNVTKAPVTVTREGDEERPGPDGPIACRVYLAKIETPNGAMEIRSWVDDDGIARHNVMTMSMGQLTATLAE